MNLIRRLLVLSLLTSTSAIAGEYSGNPKAREFIDKMVREHGFDRAELTQTLAGAEKKQAILDAIARPAEKTKPWYEYREIFLGADRIAQGVEFWREHQALLDDVSRQYGVAPQIIVAILGVETRYGRYMGSYRVLDALATLGFDYPPRANFFAGELEQFLMLAREQQQDPASLVGSYAGAMGFGQFIPSSYRRYARDYDGDGFADIWLNRSDAVASVANYFKAHGWQKGGPVMAEVSLTKPASDFELNDTSRPAKTVRQWRSEGVKTLSNADGETSAVLLEFETRTGPQYMLGFNNFYVITRYNRSRLYARAVWELSEAILAGKTSTNKPG